MWLFQVWGCSQMGKSLGNDIFHAHFIFRYINSVLGSVGTMIKDNYGKEALSTSSAFRYF